MKKFKAPKKIRCAAMKVKTKAKANSPEILIVAGIVGVVGSTIMACKATTKAHDILDEAKNALDAVHTVANNPLMCETHDYTPEDRRKDVTVVYAQTALKLTACYAPAFILGGLSIASILTSHNIMRKRNAALSTAFAATSKAFNEYRGRVVEKYGADVDREMRYGIKAKKIEETIIDENGKAKKVKSTVEVADTDACEDWNVFIFDSTNPLWTGNMDMDILTLKCEQQYATDKLRADGHLFMNDALYRTGFHKTPIGQRAGWIWDPHNDDEERDGFVDFRIQPSHRFNDEFPNGVEPIIILEFNCDGDIYSQMKTARHANKF